jgi:exodeoxyribonuclease V beta subunit
MKPFSLDQPLPRGVALLEASAGTGKTFSIAGLALRLIAEKGIEVGELLIVTFTRAATAELASRIHQRLLDGARALRAHSQALTSGNPPPETEDPVITALVRDVDGQELLRRLLRVESAIASFDEASISTIHGFCQRALQSAAFESSTEFEVEMEADLGPLVDECIDDFMALRFVDAPDSYFALLRGPGKLERKSLAKLANALRGDPGAEVLPTAKTSSLDLHNSALAAFVCAWKAGAEAFTNELQSARKAKTLTFFKDTPYQPAGLKRAVAAVDSWVEAASEGELLPPVEPAHFHLLSRTTLNERVNSGELPESEIPDCLDALLYPPLTALRVEFAASFREALARKKHERGILAFDDQIRRLHDALLDSDTGPALRAVIEGNYRAALIDESQDTDALQWAIFRGLFGEGERPLYLIGDPKQAIYSFRGADIATYLQAREEAGEQRYGLQTNWRSDAPLVETLNALYRRNPVLAPGIEVPPVRAAPGHEHAALQGASIAAPLVLRHFPEDLVGSSERGRLPYSKAFPAALAMAEYAAAELCRLLGEGASLPDPSGKGRRPLDASDIAVLVDTHKEAAAVESELRRRGVPCVRGGHGSVFDSVAANAMSLWLKAVLESRRAGSLRAVLVGPMIGLSALELDELDELAWEDWNESFSRWRQLWKESGVNVAWGRFCAHVDLRSKLLARPGGGRLWTDLEQLAELLHQAEGSAHLQPGGLIRWFARWPEPSRDTPDEHQLRLERDDAAVQISTLHASKGLEYGIVLCPVAWKGARPPATESLRVRVPDRDPPWVLDLRDEGRSPDKRDNLVLAEQAATQEEGRKLYVAMTRAKHQLIVYWGAFEGSTRGPLARLLFPELGAEELRELDDEGRLRVLDDAKKELDPGLCVHAFDELDLDALLPPSHGVVPEDLTTRTFGREQIDRQWRRASYSSLSRNAQFRALEALDDANPRSAGIDHDEHVQHAELAASDETNEASLSGQPFADQVALASFTRGAAAGTFLHEVLEFLDFKRLDDRSYLLELCEGKLGAHGLDPAMSPLIARSLAAALRTPLGGPLDRWALCDLDSGDRVDEMQFDLPLAGGYGPQLGAPSSSRAALSPRQIRGQDIAALFAKHRQPSRAIPKEAIDHYASMRFDRPVRGFLTGAIDLFFRAPTLAGETRYFVCDYKSNWLGDADKKRSSHAHYGTDALASAMVHHDYHLQYHLYALATHRYLRARLGTRYDYEKHFGGVYYLFLRGMGGADARPLDGDQLAPGVFYDRPPFAFIDALDELFTEGGSQP